MIITGKFTRSHPRGNYLFNKIILLVIKNSLASDPGTRVIIIGKFTTHMPGGIICKRNRLADDYTDAQARCIEIYAQQFYLLWKMIFIFSKIMDH